MSKHKQKHTVGRTVIFIFAGLTLLSAVLSIFLKGKNIATLNSKGLVADQERGIIIFAVIVVLAIAVPTVFFLYLTAFKYRESNHNTTYHPAASHGKLFVFTIWALPTLFMFILAMVLVPVTHKLEPNKSLASGVQPITIQVVAMRWKWLFIYPDQQVATVNFVQIPKNRPVVFELTADDAPMSSFWVPNLSGQLYAMTGHVNRLNLMGSEIGDYPGRSAEINGAGFEGMKFITRVSSEEDFASWAQGVRSSSALLDNKAYDSLLKPTENNQAASFLSHDNSLYARVVMKYMRSHHHSVSTRNESSN